MPVTGVKPSFIVRSNGEDDSVHVCKPFEWFDLFDGRPFAGIAVETLRDASCFLIHFPSVRAHLPDQMFDGNVDSLKRGDRQKSIYNTISDHTGVFPGAMIPRLLQ